MWGSAPSPFTQGSGEEANCRAALGYRRLIVPLPAQGGAYRPDPSTTRGDTPAYGPDRHFLHHRLLLASDRGLSGCSAFLQFLSAGRRQRVFLSAAPNPTRGNQGAGAEGGAEAAGLARSTGASVLPCRGADASANMAAAAARSARLVAWGERLRRGVAARPVAASLAGVALAGGGVAWYHGLVNVAAPQGRHSVLAQVGKGPCTGRPALLRRPARDRGGGVRFGPGGEDPTGLRKSPAVPNLTDKRGQHRSGGEDRGRVLMQP